jgi:hypothetical protein
MLVLAGGVVAGTLDIAYACRFWALKRNAPVQRPQRPLLCGAGYGLLLYGIMNYVVVPLSADEEGYAHHRWPSVRIDQPQPYGLRRDLVPTAAASPAFCRRW